MYRAAISCNSPVGSPQRGSLLIVLPCGGDKSSQAKDIALAVKLAKEV